MTIGHLFPSGRPSLDLNFAAARELDPRVTFSRASTATYTNSVGLIQAAAVDEARFDYDPATKKSLGLLIEESRTNLMLNTSTPDTSNWDSLSGGATPVSSTSTAPDGSTGCIRIQSSVATGGGKRLFDPAATGTHICSVYARSRTGVAQSVYCTLSSTSSTITTTLPADGSWIRVISDATDVPAITSKTFGIRASDSSGCDIDVWGEQAEEGIFETSFIPTSGSTVTRAVDIASITGDNFSSWYNPAESTWFASGSQLELDQDGNQNDVGTLFADRYANIGPQRWRAGSWRGVQAGSAVISAFSTPVTPKNQIINTAYAIDGTNAKMAVEGVLSGVGSLGAYPGTTELQIAASPSNSASASWNGHISRLSYYSRRLTDEQLQTLTS
jgi:hypothetical protein